MEESITNSESNESKKYKKEHIAFTSGRRFGVELEVNSFDGKDRPPNNEQPKGIDVIAAKVAAICPSEGCEIRAYEHTNNNRCWVAKPDSSCGMEICSPPKKGWVGLSSILEVVKAFQDDPKIKADHRCSVHVHIEVADLTPEQVAAVVAWWVKCEPVLIDAMPLSRKRNRYCQLIGMSNSFQHDGNYTPEELISRVGDVKYYSMNTASYCAGRRKSLEFRTIEGDGCKDAYLVKQWVRFLVHFIEMAASTGLPSQYKEPKSEEEKQNITPWQGLAWLDPIHVLTFLGFNNVPCEIPKLRSIREYTWSNGMSQTRNWFLARLVRFMSKHKPGGMRYYASKQLEGILERERLLGNEINPAIHLSPSELLEEKLFGDNFRI